MELPLPKTRSGWFVAFILLIVSFGYYYTVLYDEIYEVYQAQFYMPAIVETDNWKIEAQTPKYASKSTAGWIYGRIVNKSAQKIEDVDFSVIVDNENTLLLPSIYKDDVFQRSIPRMTIIGNSTIYFRIRFGNNMISADDCSDSLKFNLNGEILKPVVALPCPETNTLKSIKRSAIENLLLPPWANTLIPALIFVLCYLAESDAFEKKDNSLGALLFIGIYSFVELLTLYKWVTYFLGKQGDGISIWLGKEQSLSAVIVLTLLWFTILVIPEKWKLLSGGSSWLVDKVKRRKASQPVPNEIPTRQSQNTMLCPSCGKQIPIDAKECPDCHMEIKVAV
jgi:hypothetical protein